MALNVGAWESALKLKLADGLKDIYQQMHSEDEAKNDNWFADQLADLLASVIASTGTDQIKTAGIPIGAVIVDVTGQAAGVPNSIEITVE